MNEKPLDEYDVFIWKLKNNITYIGMYDSYTMKINEIIYPYSIDEATIEGNTIVYLTPITTVLGDLSARNLLINEQEILLSPFKASDAFASVYKKTLGYDANITRKRMNETLKQRFISMGSVLNRYIEEEEIYKEMENEPQNENLKILFQFETENEIPN